MTLTKQLVLRYRSAEHIRFALPEALCAAATASRLAAELRGIEGIYRVDLSPRQRKLSIRFMEHILDFNGLCHALYGLITAVERSQPDSNSVASVTTVVTRRRQRLPAFAPLRWLRGKWQEARETAAAVRILARREAVRQRASALFSEDAVVPILNDALTLYLIRLHWPLITQQWLRNPWLHRYEWMATSYLLYLFVRTRRHSG